MILYIYLKETFILRKILSFFLIFIFLTTSVSGCNPKTQTISDSAFYFNTIITITLYDTNDTQLLEDCFSIAQKYENLLSATIETSDISRINSNPGIFIEVEPETVDVLKKALYYCELSNGAFDITVGNLSKLWNFSEISSSLNETHELTEPTLFPDETVLAQAVQQVNYRNIIIDNNQVMLNNAYSQIDLGGIAKGYIADKMKEYLISEDVHSGIINLGGNILTIGEKTDGSAYNIGIQKPFEDSDSVISSVEVKDSSVVTSGVYERYYIYNDHLYHHILDTNTGYPVENNLYSVTIICKSSTDADALSTICFSLGLEKGIQLINSLENTEAMFITNEYKIYTSDNFDSL